MNGSGYVTGFGKACIVHISNFSTLVTHKINIHRCETFRDCRTTISVSSLKVSHLYTIPCSFYESPNEKNWMCELCTFSQIRSHMEVEKVKAIIILVYLAHICSPRSSRTFTAAMAEKLL